MKILRSCALLVGFALCCAASAVAQEHGSVSFMTGLSVSNGNALTSALASLAPGVSDRVNLSGRVTFNVAPGFQAVGEVGRLGNVLPPFETDVLAFTRVDLRASAFYGEGGVRTFLGGSRSSINPYIEATGGLAHLSVRVHGFNSTADAISALGLNFADRTSPMAGLGAGVMLNAGRVTFDAGYRYKKIFAQDFVTELLSVGQRDLTSHQAVFGVGVRF
jgi:hypothetical protein